MICKTKFLVFLGLFAILIGKFLKITKTNNSTFFFKYFQFPGVAQAKTVSRCNKAVIGGNIWDDRATNSCKETMGLYCYNYNAKVYCETLTPEIVETFTKCCASHGRDNVWTKEI